MEMEWIDLFPGYKHDSALVCIAANIVEKIMQVSWQSEDSLQELQRARKACYASIENSQETQKVYVAISVMCDLRGQGWTLAVRQGRVLACKPGSEEESPQRAKARIRAGLILERDVQLQRFATRRFVRDMECRQIGPSGWTSIYSLMRDGAELANSLTQTTKISDLVEREAALRNVIDPYIQVVDDSSCEFTGLELKSIWRYFRHTWSIPHKTVPGRNIWFLIRDRAVENHPVIGIAALGSSIVQTKERDKWIGWDREVFLSKLRANPAGMWVSWIEESWEQLIQGVYIVDFFEELLLDPADLASPGEETIDRLTNFAKKERDKHRLYPEKAAHKSDISDVDWIERAKTYLFRSKRASTLAKLLNARLRLLQTGFFEGKADALERALNSKDGRNAISEILRQIKASHVGIGMMDITVCGAVAPYNHILGGKLVALLMMSPEVVEAYQERYGEKPSIIASSMAGRPVIRAPQLVLLGTTSLYGVGSSQYNRLRLPVREAGGTGDTVLHYEYLYHTEGYGSFHLSSNTLAEIARLLAQNGEGRRVNSIFGEGVNPRLRKVREALDLVGFPSDDILQHGNQRIIYGIPLAVNFRQVLIGLEDEARWLLPIERPKEITSEIAGFWIRRWLARRIEKERILRTVAEHTLTYPIAHGARVPLPPLAEEEPLFNRKSDS